MFRSTKKKPKSRGALRRKDDDDDDEDKSGTVTTGLSTTIASQEKLNGGEEEEDECAPVVIRRQMDKSKRKGSRKRGLNIMADDSKKRKTKKSAGLGFGGMTTIIDDDENDVFQTEVENLEHDAPSYGKEAIEALKAAQNSAKPKELVAEPHAADGVEESTILKPPLEVEELDDAPEKSKEILTEKLKERNFIPLHEEPEDTNHPTMLLDDDGNPITVLEDPGDDDQDWADHVAKRAGIQPSAPKSRTTPPIASLGMLRENLQSTIQNLKAREEDTSNVMMRREADLAQTRSDFQRQKQSIEEAGKACTDYQQLRLDLANWVGALRDLEEKVSPIQQSLIEMMMHHFEMAQKEWLDWQDDVCITLDECGKLDRVLGRVPKDLGVQDAGGGVDEFGRDIGSQKKRDRNNRFARRRREKEMLAETASIDLILDYLWTKEEEVSRRYDILQKALRVAKDDLDDEYSNIETLIECFAAWKKGYSDEYKQCYADLSLVQLLHVFDQVDFCKAPWIRSLTKVHAELTFDGKLYGTTSMHARDRDESDTSASSAVERCIRKQLVPFILEVLREFPSSLFLSTRMSIYFSTGILDLIEQIGLESESSKTICGAIVEGGKCLLLSLSIPLLKSGNGAESDERLVDSMDFAKDQLILFVQGLILNILKYWMPLLQKVRQEYYRTLGMHCLHFLSETYLFYLSSLQQVPTSQSQLAPIWRCLADSHRIFLESPEFMIQSAPLRAAANAYGLPRLDNLN